jgi:hypothetical protein
MWQVDSNRATVVKSKGVFQDFRQYRRGASDPIPYYQQNSLDLPDNKAECRQQIIRIYTRRSNDGLENEYIDREKNEYPGFTY